jgi:hypothetical protein
LTREPPIYPTKEKKKSQMAGAKTGIESKQQEERGHELAQKDKDCY